MEVTLCIPTLSRYDLLRTTIETAEKGTVVPNKYFIIDNGLRFTKDDFYESLGERLYVHRIGYNIGVARSWNYFCQNTKDIRIICNDDVVFFEDTIELLVSSFTSDAVTYPAGVPATNSFSCFVMPDSVVKAVGYFDEDISPNYAYFEDNDYHRRMMLLGYSLTGVENCRLGHGESSTLKSYSSEERKSHDKKFELARDNYEKKWGGLPGKETLVVPRKV